MTEGYLRYPHLHGDTIVAVADDDLWLVPTEGGRASRLTADHEPCTFPFFSPDGSRIAYSSVRDGDWEVFVLDRSAGTAERLTWWGRPTTRVRGWLDDEHVLVASDAGEPFSQRRRLFSVGLDGSIERLPYGHSISLAVSSSGAEAVTSPNHRDAAMWKRYRGGTAPMMWLRPDAAAEWRRVLPDEEAGLWSPAWVGDRLVFTSDLGAGFPDRGDEQAQVWSVDAQGGDLRQHTSHTSDLGYVRDTTTDGRRVVYHARGRIYVMDSLDAEPRLVEADLGPLPRPRRVVTAEDRLLALRPDDKANGSVAEWYGQAWWLTHRGGPARHLLGDDSTRIREARVAGDTVVAVTDEGGEDALVVTPIDGGVDAHGGGSSARRVAAGRLGRVLHVALPPAADVAGVVSHDGRVSLVDLGESADDEPVRELSRCEHGEPVDLTFSPDGRYLVWSEPLATEGTHRLMVADRQALGDDATAVRALTSGRFHDFSPAFTRDGRHLVFLSARTLDPHYSAFGFDLAFTDATRPWLAPLAADTPAPLGPAADGWPLEEVTKNDADAADRASAGTAGTTAKNGAVTCPDLDAGGFEDRLVPLPVASGDMSSLRSAKDGVLWIRHAAGGELGTVRAGLDDELRDQLERFDLATRTAETLGDVDSYEVSGDGTRIVVRDRDAVRVGPATEKVDSDSEKLVTVDTSRLRREVDLRTSWRAMFDDNGRIMRDHFWRDDMNGVDWDAVLDRYRPVLDRIATHDDLVDVLWETVGELDTSHAYVQPRPGGRDDAVAHLGIDHTHDAGGAVVLRILPGESSDPDARSPLRGAGVDARDGDRIVAVDGRSVDGVPLGRLLAGRAKKAVELTLERNGTRRRVAVVPILDEEVLRYQEWVASRRAYVDEKSGGRLGYLHVPDMVSKGWAQFHRGLDEATAREGLVADMRYNRGGHTSQLVVERLMRRVIGWDLVRHGTPVTYPAQAPRGPVVFLANRWSGSDGDIVNAAARIHGIGPVIGERTWGGVIGIDGRFDLVDGTGVTQPRYANHFEQFGWGVENHGVDPDIEVIFSPADAERELTVDPQLDRAIEELLRRLDEKPAATPPPMPPPRRR
ncbi:S41 family peptidase [Mobilicoccus massiliensis]|uniref:S41 family peptidase n=1 Tax=Mobilicoccus massiliensis TaxID=1522310 RepID=UPI00058FD1F9|nr:S41 family peptidase [Mobilicoccus massiliensis]